MTRVRPSDPLPYTERQTEQPLPAQPAVLPAARPRLSHRDIPRRGPHPHLLCFPPWGACFGLVPGPETYTVACEGQAAGHRGSNRSLPPRAQDHGGLYLRVPQFPYLENRDWQSCEAFCREG